MPSDRLKQRLVGVAVLVALAVIFVPVLFNLQPSRPIDQTSQIPPAPDIEPVMIEEPVRPEIDNEVPDPDQLFTPDEQPEADDRIPVEDSIASAEPVVPREVPEQTAEELQAGPGVEPTLSETGLPEGWVVQVASYSDRGAAEKQVDRLQDADFKAFLQQAQVDGKQVFRVLVGPFISRDSAAREKGFVDDAAGVESLVLSFEP